MLKASLRLLFLGLVVFFAVRSQAEAGCFTPRSFTKTYYAFVEDSNGAFWACSEIIISPMHPHHWDVIGETTRDCDGNVSSWGDTTSCPDNVETTPGTCSPICD